MRNLGLLAFAATVGILAPVVAFQLSAGPAQRAMLFAPGANSLDVNGVHVDATIDRRLVEIGGTIHLELSAPSRVEVGIVVLGATGTENSRVPDPPLAVLHETVTIEANKSKTVAIKLHGARANSEPTGNYTIYVMSVKAANKLAKALEKAGPSYGTGEIPEMDRDTQKLFSLIYKIGKDDNDDPEAKLFASTVVARFDAYTRSVSPSITIETPETAPVDRPFTVGITLKNPSKHAQKVKLAVSFPRIDDSYLGLSEDAAKAETSDDVIELASGETRRVEAKITATKPGVIGVQASVECIDGKDCYRLFRTGSFDAVQILSAAPAVAARP